MVVPKLILLTLLLSLAIKKQGVTGQNSKGKHFFVKWNN
jgi:hypothetical protein